MASLSVRGFGLSTKIFTSILFFTAQLGLDTAFAAEPIETKGPSATSFYGSFLDTKNPWTGFYVGGHLAFGFGGAQWSIPAAAPGSGYNSYKIEDQQWGPVLGGLQAGINFAFANKIVIGLEGDMTFPDVMQLNKTLYDPAGVARISNEPQAYASIKARLGYAYGDFLPYITGGFALARDRYVREQLTGQSISTLANEGDLEQFYQWRYGFVFGAGLEARLTPEWSVNIEYLYSYFPKTSSYFQLGAQLLTTRQDLSRIRLGLNYKFGAPAHDSKEATGLIHPMDDWSIHAQTTVAPQTAFAFPSLYYGPKSLYNATQTRTTVSATAYLGFALPSHTEFYFNPEPSMGFGLSRTTGLAGFSNGEAQKGGYVYPHYNTARFFARQVLGLGGEQEDVPDGLNQVAAKYDVSRLTLTAGKYSVGDLFDNNTYSHDPRTSFMNWTLMSAGGFDYAADQRGYTWGVASELNQSVGALRLGYFLEPDRPNGNNFDTRLFRRGQYIGELEGRYSLGEQAGKVRLGLWFVRANSGSFNQALYDPQYGGDVVGGNILATRRSRPESGFYINIEQAVNEDLGVFLRWSRRTGSNEIMSWTDVDRSLSFGAVLKGTTWGRPDDKIGVGGSINAISNSYRAFLQAGGLGLNIGDGSLSYGREGIFETYYSLALDKAVWLSADYQFIDHPAYNVVRGPVSIATARLHMEF